MEAVKDFPCSGIGQESACRCSRCKRPGLGDPLEWEMATQASIPAWRIPWTEEPQFSSVAQLCPTLCDPMNRSTPGLPVHHQILEFTQTRVHRVSDAIQPSHPLSSPSPPAPNPSPLSKAIYSM